MPCDCVMCGVTRCVCACGCVAFPLENAILFKGCVQRVYVFVAWLQLRQAIASTLTAATQLNHTCLTSLPRPTRLSAGATITCAESIAQSANTTLHHTGHTTPHSNLAANPCCLQVLHHSDHRGLSKGHRTTATVNAA